MEVGSVFFSRATSPGHDLIVLATTSSGPRSDPDHRFRDPVAARTACSGITSTRVQCTPSTCENITYRPASASNPSSKHQSGKANVRMFNRFLLFPSSRNAPAFVTVLMNWPRLLLIGTNNQSGSSREGESPQGHFKSRVRESTEAELTNFVDL